MNKSPTVKQVSDLLVAGEPIPGGTSGHYVESLKINGVWWYYDDMPTMSKKQSPNDAPGVPYLLLFKRL